MVYKNVDEFLESVHPQLSSSEMANNSTTSTTATTNSRPVINSNIISFKANDINVIDNLRQTPVELKFKHLISSEQNGELAGEFYSGQEETTEDIVSSSNSRPVCVYWNYDKM